jgi:hypothetical protein
MSEISKPSSGNGVTSTDESTGLWYLFILLVLGGVGYWIYTSLYSVVDSGGYVSHTIETSITAQPAWLVGEVKDCLSGTLDANSARLLGYEPGYVAQSIVCDDGPEHKMKVTLKGELSQPEHKWIRWRCTREAEGFGCEQVGAE